MPKIDARRRPVHHRNTDPGSVDFQAVAHELYVHNGRSIRKLATALGCSKDTAHRWLDRPDHDPLFSLGMHALELYTKTFNRPIPRRSLMIGVADAKVE